MKSKKVSYSFQRAIQYLSELEKLLSGLEGRRWAKNLRIILHDPTDASWQKTELSVKDSDPRGSECSRYLSQLMQKLTGEGKRTWFKLIERMLKYRYANGIVLAINFPGYLPKRTIVEEKGTEIYLNGRKINLVRLTGKNTAPILEAVDVVPENIVTYLMGKHFSSTNPKGEAIDSWKLIKEEDELKGGGQRETEFLLARESRNRLAVHKSWLWNNQKTWNEPNREFRIYSEISGLSGAKELNQHIKGFIAGDRSRLVYLVCCEKNGKQN